MINRVNLVILVRNDDQLQNETGHSRIQHSLRSCMTQVHIFEFSKFSFYDSGGRGSSEHLLKEFPVIKEEL